MKLTKLRLLGFKSFVESTDVSIEPGLTGVVGPNGCGKSNLVEALRWVMGESSHKNLRATEMDDVIFAGSGGRPARNHAEVVLTIDNRDRTAPAAFNGADVLEISRRIERDQGSTYRINGREVRARDVQLIFADASTGARSPALVRQGQIAELIAARPQARRRILEEAAGISGLHTRRHEAELRLKAAEHNLERLEDVLGQIEQQLDGLRRQSRQAARYRALSSDIRRHEALLLHIAFEDAGRQVIEAERRLDGEIRAVAEATRAQAEAVRHAAMAAEDLPPLREAEAGCAAALQRLSHAVASLEAEEKRAAERVVELDRRLAQSGADIDRETAMIEDAAGALLRLAEEAARLAAEDEASAIERAAAETGLAAAVDAAQMRETALGAAQARLAELTAGRASAEKAGRDARARLDRLTQEAAAVDRERAALTATTGGTGATDALRARHVEMVEAARAAEVELQRAETTHATARAAEEAGRGPLREAEQRAARLETEIRTLARLLLPPAGARFSPVSEELRVAPGYEAAVGAALGDDLDATTHAGAPARFAGAEPGPEDGSLPEGAEPLAAHLAAPPALARRLAQIGVVSAKDGPRLAALLRPGQRLVSRTGDLWRWDGFVSAANAPSPAATRLAERNRLAATEAEAQEARAAVPPLAAALDAAKRALAAAASAESEARARQRSAQRDAEAARDRSVEEERRQAQLSSRLAALDEARSRLGADLTEAEAAVAEAGASLAALILPETLSAEVEALAAEARLARARQAEAGASLHALSREGEARARRLAAIAGETESWQRRRDGGAGQVAALKQRLGELAAEREGLDEAPARFAAQRRAILSEQSEAEARRREAADRLAVAERRSAETDRASRDALAALGKAREDHARNEERLDGLRERRAQVAREIEETLSITPSAALKVAGLSPGDRVPERSGVERALDEARRERERLGGVNLRAEEELAEVQKQYDGLIAERDDLVEAIKRLRLAISNLNREGRERLLAAFDTVNGHFQSLFATLFGGGTAELQLTESDDPLEAGLDMLARPPGKKPQSLSLLSGGEQALTAMALIFAVFLTNPAPICVLDEVDAPLDDANVERFCDLLDAMVRQTETRFVSITHNPITMARMNRLFGVTMAERGVSQVVSVDLGEAEEFLEAV